MNRQPSQDRGGSTCSETAGRLIVILFLALSVAGPEVLAQEQAAPAFKDTTAWPEGPTGARIRSFLEVVNSGSVDRIKRFLNEECAKKFQEMVPLDDHISTPSDS